VFLHEGNAFLYEAREAGNVFFHEAAELGTITRFMYVVKEKHQLWTGDPFSP
jgi:hypothetical protein